MPSTKRTWPRLFGALAIGTPVALLFVWPQAVHAETVPVIAHALSFRAPLAIGFGLGALVLLAVALRRRRRGVAAGLAVVLGAASLANGAVLLARGGDASIPEGDLVVVAWNTWGGASPESIVRLVLETDADIVSLPETGEETAGEVARLLAIEGKAMRVDTTVGTDDVPHLPTSLLVASELGDYRIDAEAGSSPKMSSGLWLPVDGTGPAIAAAHLIPPLPDSIDEWRAGMQWVADRCEDSTVIVAGDLNATLDHLSSYTGGCRDAAREGNAAATGSWPAFAPAWLGSPIDHVLVGADWDVRGAAVLTSFDDAGSDHRPIVAVLDAR
ncbi:endonuclease/exonuclease/phosphatase family protein [Microbacterium rhizophilus]|uniref:endonuclease/exonuclease/phosphatase family protein n=1 Tax=Microbacterium rhizophilus TaxID=3138934 RepID=UPI0031EE4768